MCLDDLNEEKIFPQYLLYFLQQRKLEDVITGSAQPQITREGLRKIQIPLPPLPIQQQIAEVLDTADALRRCTQQQLEALDELAQGVFLEMFGEIEYSENGDELREFIKINHGYAFKSTSFNNEQKGIPVIKIGTVNKGYFDVSGLSFYNGSITGLNRFIIKPGDLLMSLTGTVGKDDYANLEIASNSFEEYFLNQRVAKIELIKGKMHPIFALFLFRQKGVKNHITRLNRGIRQANVSNDDIYEFKTRVPPLPLQTQFAAIITNIEEQKAVLRESLRESEALFGGLLQRVFG